MRKLLLVLNIFLILSCEFNSSDSYLKKAEELEQQGQFELAISLLDKAIEKDPNNIYALLNRGVDKSILKNYNGAIDDYTIVIQIHPENTLAYLNRGKNKQRLENYIGAINDFEKAITTKGNEIIYIDKSENSFIDNGFQFDVSMESILYERGISRYYIDSLQQAFDDFNFCIRKDYLKKENLYWRGLIYLRIGEQDKGCEDLREAESLGETDATDIINEYCN